MNCNRIQSLLSAYADRELTGVEMFLVRQHVHDCDECRVEEEELLRVRSILGSLEIPTPSPDFEDRLIQAVMNGQPAPEERRRIRWASGFAAAGLSAAAVACFAYGIHGAPQGSKVNAKAAAPTQSLKSSDPSMSASLERDSALINSSDPLAGPQVAVVASFDRR